MANHAQRAREQLAGFKERADRRLRQLADVWEQRSETDGLAEASSPLPARELVRSVTELTLRGGKRVRPALAYYAACCFDHGLTTDAGSDEPLLDAVLSLELLQTYLLIHDDVMDADPERRGGPSVHVQLSRQVGSEVLGRSLAILAGDLACALAQELLVAAPLPRQRVLAAQSELVRMQWEVILGQHLDLVRGAAPAVIHDAKTASYTTRGPVRLGGALAGATAAQLERLTRYGTPLGRAFQLRDDLLGTFGKAAALGKPVGADLRAGKRTALVEEALAAADASQRATLELVMGEPDATDEQIGAACAVIEATGARRANEALIDELTAEALAALQAGELRDEGRAFLQGVALLLADRDR